MSYCFVVLAKRIIRISFCAVLRMEQDVEKFIRDPTQQQLEFQQLPTSYLRLAAHRVAQHYFLQSMVLLDNNTPDGSGSRIIVRKTAECQLPVIRLADIPVSLPSEETGVVKVAIKQRPQKRSSNANSANLNSLKANSSKSVEERKEEYNKARARIFSGHSTSIGAIGRSESEPRLQDNFQHVSLVNPKMEEKPGLGITDINSGRGLIDSSTTARTARNRTEKEPIGRYNYRPNNRVAIFRDREVDRKDPDYDRNYDRYLIYCIFLFFLCELWWWLGVNVIGICFGFPKRPIKGLISLLILYALSLSSFCNL